VAVPTAVINFDVLNAGAATFDADAGAVTTIDTSCVDTLVDSAPDAEYGVIVKVNVYVPATDGAAFNWYKKVAEAYPPPEVVPIAEAVSLRLEAPPNAGDSVITWIEVNVSFAKKRKDGVPPPVGTELSEELITTESFCAFANQRTFTEPAVVESAVVVVAFPFEFVTAIVPTTAACEGTELSTPRPNAATATSAMRLKFVVVDICFLSIVVSKYFLEAASR
jgi:hypothetical protein